MPTAEHADPIRTLVRGLTEAPTILPIPPLPTHLPIPVNLRAFDFSEDSTTARGESPIRALSQTIDQIYVHFFQTALQRHPNAVSARAEARQNTMNHLRNLTLAQHLQVDAVSIQDNPNTSDHDVLSLKLLLVVDNQPTWVGLYSTPLGGYAPIRFDGMERR